MENSATGRQPKKLPTLRGSTAGTALLPSPVPPESALTTSNVPLITPEVFHAIADGVLRDSPNPAHHQLVQTGQTRPNSAPPRRKMQQFPPEAVQEMEQILRDPTPEQQRVMSASRARNVVLPDRAPLPNRPME